MLSEKAFNAFLKTLEEPPPHAKFIFATTEIRKVPITVLSRCQRSDFGRLSEQEIISRLKQALVDGLSAEEGAVRLIAAAAQGRMGDAWSLMDMCLGAEKHLTQENVRLALGTVSEDFLFEFARALLDADTASALALTDRLMKGGRDVQVFLREFNAHLRQVLRTTQLRRYFIRCLIGMVSMWMGFWAIANLPLAQAVSLAYSSPIFVTIAAVLLLGERPVTWVPFETAERIAFLWPRGDEQATPMLIIPPKATYRRHRRKYAHGDVGAERSFYFCGPANECNERATNLVEFMQIGDMVDEETWRFHLEHGDFTRWLGEVIRDPELECAASQMETRYDLLIAERRTRLRRVIEAAYTLPV